MLSSMKKATRVFLRTLLPAFVGLVVLVAIIAWLAGVFVEKIPPGQSPVAARKLGPDQKTDTVHEVTRPDVEQALGTVRAASRTVVSARVLATIEEMLVSAGDEVSEGQVLIRLSSEELEARLKQAQQSLVAAQATREAAEKVLHRAENLRKSNAVSDADYDAAKAQLEVAQAQQGRAEQAVTEAKVMLSYATITATKAGRIVDRLAEPGDTASPGQPLLTLYDARSLRLEAPVREELAVTLKVGQKLTVRIDSLNRDLEASIDQIVPQAEAASRSLLVKAALPVTPGLYEGLFGRLLIDAGERSHLCLAQAAIERVGQLDFVEVVGENRSLERRFIQVGRTGEPGRVEVLSGLKAGDKVAIME